MTHVDHKQALAFVTICAEGSIRATADYLGLEPSTITRQIQALDKKLTITLIHIARATGLLVRALHLLRSTQQQSSDIALLARK